MKTAKILHIIEIILLKIVNNIIEIFFILLIC